MNLASIVSQQLHPITTLPALCPRIVFSMYRHFSIAPCAERRDRRDRPEGQARRGRGSQPERNETTQPQAALTRACA
eukprot:284816-Pleurochrysis_carterae.AAC.1